MAYDTTALLADIRRTAGLPASTANGTDDTSLLAVADMCMRSWLVPLLHSVNEEYYVREFSIAVPASTTGQPTRVRLPSRGVASTARTVQYVANNGALYNLQRIEPERRPQFLALTTGVGQPWGFWVEGSYLVLLPGPQQAATLLVRAQVRPGQLVAVTAGLQITAVGTSGTNYLLTCGDGSSIVNGTTDIITSQSPFEHLALDEPIPQTNVVTAPQADFLTAPLVGDYIAVADTSPVVQVPVELNPALVRYTAAQVLRNLGRVQQAQDMEADAVRTASNACLLLAPRTEGSPRKIVGGVAWGRRRIGVGYGW